MNSYVYSHEIKNVTDGFQNGVVWWRYSRYRRRRGRLVLANSFTHHSSSVRAGKKGATKFIWFAASETKC